MSARQLLGVIFDMDGVLVDSHAVHRKAWRRFFQTLELDVPESEFDFTLDGRKRCDILRHFLGDCPDAELEELGRRKDCIFRQMRLDVAPIPGAVQLVEELHRRGIALALATSASRSRAHSTLLELGLLECFQAVVTGEDVAAGKPDPAVYRLARTRLDIDAPCVLAVEDAISGVQAAVGAGLLCLGVALHENPDKLAAAGALHVVASLQSVSLHDLETLVRGDGISQAAAVGSR